MKYLKKFNENYEFSEDDVQEIYDIIQEYIDDWNDKYFWPIGKSITKSVCPDLETPNTYSVYKVTFGELKGSLRIKIILDKGIINKDNVNAFEMDTNEIVSRLKSIGWEADGFWNDKVHLKSKIIYYGYYINIFN